MALAKVKEWLTGALVVLALLIFVPGTLSATVLPALLLIVLIAEIALSFKLNQPVWGIVFSLIAVALIVMWFIPGTQFSLPNLSF